MPLSDYRGNNYSAGKARTRPVRKDSVGSLAMAAASVGTLYRREQAPDAGERCNRCRQPLVTKTGGDLEPQWVCENGCPQGAAPIRVLAREPGRNEACPCGSGKKFKRCCLLARMAKSVAPKQEPTPEPEQAAA